MNKHIKRRNGLFLLAVVAFGLAGVLRWLSIGELMLYLFVGVGLGCVVWAIVENIRSIDNEQL